MTLMVVLTLLLLKIEPPFSHPKVIKMEPNLSIQALIQLAKQAADILESPPRLYQNDASGVYLWPDKPSQVQC